VTIGTGLFLKYN